MKKSVRLLQILLNVVLCFATLLGAFFSCLQYFRDADESIGKLAQWLSPFLAVPFWLWLVVAITSAVLCFFLHRRRKLKKLGRSPPPGLDDPQLRHKIHRQLTFTKFTKHCREIAGLYYCICRDPECAPVHGAALVLGTSSSPFNLFRIIAWLRRKLTSTPHGFAYPLPTLKTLTEVLQTQINKQRLFWPKDFQKTFHKLAMDTYNAVARYAVEAVERGLFLYWQIDWSAKFQGQDPHDVPLEQGALLQSQQGWKTEVEDLTNAASGLFDVIANPIHEWLKSLNTPAEVEEATLAQIIPTLFALPVKIDCGHNQVAMVVSKMQELAKTTMPEVWRSYEEWGFEVWLYRLQLILKTNVLVYLWRWLDVDDKQTILKRTWSELKRLYEKKCDGSIQPIDTHQLFAEFDQHILKKVLGSLGEFDKDWAKEFVSEIDSLAEHARCENALPIAIICESIGRRLKSAFELV